MYSTTVSLPLLLQSIWIVLFLAKPCFGQLYEKLKSVTMFGTLTIKFSYLKSCEINIWLINISVWLQFQANQKITCTIISDYKSKYVEHYKKKNLVVYERGSALSWILFQKSELESNETI